MWKDVAKRRRRRSQNNGRKQHLERSDGKRAWDTEACAVGGEIVLHSTGESKEVRHTSVQKRV